MKRLKTFKIIAVILFLGALFCTVDLGLNLLFNMEPSIHNGSYGTYSLLHAVFGILGIASGHLICFSLHLKIQYGLHMLYW